MKWSVHDTKQKEFLVLTVVAVKGSSTPTTLRLPIGISGELGGRDDVPRSKYPPDHGGNPRRRAQQDFRVYLKALRVAETTQKLNR